MKEVIQERIKKLEESLDKSAAQHNALLGAMNELKALHNQLMQHELIQLEEQDENNYVHPSQEIVPG